MKFSRFFLFYAILASVCGTAHAAQTVCPPEAVAPTPDSLKEAMRQKQDRGFLWKITKGGHSSWLYGTLHVAKQSWIIPGKTLLHAVANSLVVGVELDLNDPVTAKILTAPDAPATQAWLAKTGRTQAVEAARRAACVPVTKFGDLPLALQVDAVALDVGKAQGYYPDYAVDSVFVGIAHSTHRQVVALEEATTQRKFLLGQSKEDEARKIDTRLQEIASGKALSGMVEVATLWEKSDLAGLESYAARCEETAKICTQAAAEMTSRNTHMAQKIADMHEAGLSVFTAVGFLHMAGPNGLPALMTKHGFSVEQVLPAVKASL